MTAVEICNMALGRIGVKAFIDDLDDTSRMEAVVCKQFFQPSLDGMLAMFPWDFTQGLVQLTGPLSNPRNGWAYMYALPADCLNPIRLQTDAVVFPPSSKDRIAYQIGYDSTNGAVLLTNYPDMYLVYTRKVTDIALLPPLFCDALAWKIAADAAMALAVKGDFEQVARERYHQVVSNAAATSLRIGQDEGEPPSELITVRY
jgi:hypothetical protein